MGKEAINLVQLFRQLVDCGLIRPFKLLNMKKRSSVLRAPFFYLKVSRFIA